MDTPQRAITRPARDAVKLPRGWTEHSPGELPRPALTGRMLDDRFELLGRLGEGGMADLYLGDDRHLRCKVAIKILRDDSPDSRQRFLREAEVLSNVRHENIVDVVARGVMQPGGMPYTVLRYLPGEDLKTRLHEGGPLPWATVVEIGIQIADALACLHEEGVLHRDVKPENIMWTHHTSRRVFVKLIDLGTARASARFQSRQDRSYTPVCGRRETATGAAIGTPGYMPPEAGLGDPDARTDIFGLGVTLYQLCTGKMPDDPLTPPPLRAANPAAKTPEDLERVIMAALHWDIAERTPSAARIRDELSALRTVHAPSRGESGLFAGRIELREHLATGAEAEVFRAYHQKLRRPVALKRMLERLEGNPDDRARFEREAWVLASVRHPGLPEVYDSGTADGRAYTVMELCAGRPAQRFCDDATRLRLAEVLMVGIQVAETMQAVHAMGVIHRDLSAQNILIEAGREPRVKVIDFTGCLLTDRFFSLRDEPRPADALEVDRPLHMLPFAAPEVRAEQRWSKGSDIYALGVLLYRLLTGKMPYTTQARDQYIPLSRSSHSRSVDHVLAAMLNPDPVQRLADMAMVAERLRDALEEETAGDEQPAARPQLTLVAAPMDDTAPPAADEEACPIAADAGLAPTSPQPSPTVANEGPASPERLAVGSPSASPLPSATMQRSWRIPLLLGGFGALAVLLGVLAWSWYPRPTTKPEPAARLVSTATRPPFEPAHAVDVAPGLSTPENSPAPLDQPKPADDKAATVIAPSVPRPRLNQATVHRLLASRVKTCSDKWLTLKLRVVGGVGHVETINGFLPQPGLQGAQRCVTDAIASTRFPSTTSATFTLRFAPTR